MLGAAGVRFCLAKALGGAAMRVWANTSTTAEPCLGLEAIFSVLRAVGSAAAATAENVSANIRTRRMPPRCERKGATVIPSLLA